MKSRSSQSSFLNLSKHKHFFSMHFYVWGITGAKLYVCVCLWLCSKRMERDLLNVQTRIQLPMTNLKPPLLQPRQPISQVTHIARHLFPVFILWVILFSLFPPHLLQFTFLPSYHTGRLCFDTRPSGDSHSNAQQLKITTKKKPFQCSFQDKV